MCVTGRIIRDKAEVIIIFKVNGKCYPATTNNRDIMDAYIHTGDEKYLTQLENEMEDFTLEYPQYQVEQGMSDSLSAAILNGEMNENDEN